MRVTTSQTALRLFCAALLLALAMPGTARAQLLYGSIVGNVTDTTEGSVPGVTVSAANAKTGQTRTVTSNDTGYYAILNLDPGEYLVTLSKEGFRQSSASRVAVTINNVTRLDVTLQVGVVAETINVSAETLAIQADRADVRSEITSKALVNLPVPPGRNYQQLFTTLPGFAPPENAHSIPANPSRGLRFYVNGTTSNTVNTRIDGASSTNIYIPHIAGYVPALEAIETVNVVTNAFDAEQGLAGGAAVNVQIKSGSNDLHGSAFWYLNNNRTKAKPFFLPAGQRIPKVVYNQAGATAGGPIRKNKLFYFLSYEGTFDHKLGTGTGSIPTPAMREGDLSPSRTAIYDPFTGNRDGSGRTPIPGNIIPRSRIDARTAKILPLWPAPNIPGDRPQSNYYAAQSTAFNRNTLDAKLNWNISPKLSAYGRTSLLLFSSDNMQWFGPDLGGPVISTAGQAGHATGRVNNSTFAATYLASPGFLVDAYFGYSYMTVDSRQPHLDRNIGLDVLGIPGTNGTRYFEGGWPRFDIENFTTIGIPNNFMPMAQDDPQFQWVANANWTRSNHNIRFGADLYYQEINQAQPEMQGSAFGASGGFAFQQAQTRLRGGPAGSEYNSFASFLLGTAARTGRTVLVPPALMVRSWMYSAYLRDRWQATRKLTLNYGVRWEYSPIMFRNDHGIERYDWANNKMLIGGVGGIPRDTGIHESKRLFVPRLGFAYRLREDFVIRAGYGITNDPYTYIRALRGNYPVIVASEFNSPDGFSPGALLSTGIPAIRLPDLTQGVIDVDGRVALYSFMDNNYKRGYIQSWNFTLQKQLSGGFLAEAGYVATRTIRQAGALDRNAGVPGGGEASRPLNILFGRTARTSQITGVGTHTYDSLQTRLQRQFASGHQVSLSYTFSKAIGTFGAVNSDGGPAIALPAYYHLNRAVSSIDRTHSFHATGVAELPFGRGKQWANGRVAAAFLGGWQLNGVLSMYTGEPFSATAPANDLNAPGNSQRADLVKPVVEKLGGTGPRLKYYDPTAFAPVRAPRFGTAGYNILRAPGTINLDAGLFRRFRITERLDMQFRAEAFNSTNTPHFSAPNGDANSATFMEISSTRGTGREGIDERVFRFGLRLGW